MDIVIGEEDSAKAPSSKATALGIDTSAAEAKMDEAIRQAEADAAQRQGGEQVLARLRVTGLRAIRKESVAYQAAQQGMGGAKAFDLSALNTPDQIDQRIANFDYLLQASRDMKRALNGIPELFRQEMRTAGMKEEQIPESVVAAVRVIKLPEQLQEQEQAALVCNAAIAQLKVLKRNWGKWKAEGPQSVRFDSVVSASEQSAFEDYRVQLRSALGQMGGAAAPKQKE